MGSLSRLEKSPWISTSSVAVVWMPWWLKRRGRMKTTPWDETVLYHMDPVLFKEKHVLVSSSSFSSSCVVVVVVGPVGRGSFMILGSFQVFQVSRLKSSHHYLAERFFFYMSPLPRTWAPPRQDRNDEQLQVGRVFIMGETEVQWRVFVMWVFLDHLEYLSGGEWVILFILAGFQSPQICTFF